MANLPWLPPIVPSAPNCTASVIKLSNNNNNESCLLGSTSQPWIFNANIRHICLPVQLIGLTDGRGGTDARHHASWQTAAEAGELWRRQLSAEPKFLEEWTSRVEDSTEIFLSFFFFYFSERNLSFLSLLNFWAATSRSLPQCSVVSPVQEIFTSFLCVGDVSSIFTRGLLKLQVIVKKKRTTRGQQEKKSSMIAVTETPGRLL